MSESLTLISHYLCPYVQRAVIALKEKEIPFEQIYIDLGNKPDWFRQISPLGKVPILKVNDQAVFESSVILEYLEDTQLPPLHPADPLQRATHRSWMEYGSSILNDIGGMYSANDKDAFDLKSNELGTKFGRLEDFLMNGPYFAGQEFTLVDAVYGPVFRYFDVFDKIQDFGIFNQKPRVSAWRSALQKRPSVRNAVTNDYEERLWQFLLNKNSYITSLMN